MLQLKQRTAIKRPMPPSPLLTLKSFLALTEEISTSGTRMIGDESSVSREDIPHHLTGILYPNVTEAVSHGVRPSMLCAVTLCTKIEGH